MSSIVLSKQQQQLVISLIEELKMARSRDKIERERFKHSLSIYYPFICHISRTSLRMFEHWLEEKRSLQEDRTSLRAEQDLLRTEREALRRERGELENEREDIRRSRMSLDQEKEQMRRDQDRGDNRWAKSYNW